MNIILGEAAAQQASERYVVLELDQFQVQGHPDITTAYCVIENVGIEDIPLIPQLRAWHRDLVRAFREADWPQVQHNLSNLRGRWNGELDSFYDDIQQRMIQQQNQPQDGWNPVRQGA